MNNNIQPLNIKDLLSLDKYRIPIYQRNYDWGEKESLQLLEDIADYASTNKDKKYYIGSLIVFARHDRGSEYYETIDGQQRLTTLTILMTVLCSIEELKSKMDWFKNVNLSYDHRNEADDAIRLLLDGRFSEHPSVASISEVYKILKKNLVPILKSKKLKLTVFVDYLLANVIIMRIPVPQDTELNHYFEIMNSRGEQLEKHEVLKAKLMKHLEEDEEYASCLFNDIWEACANMNTYVQMNVKPQLRNIIFSNNWIDFQDLDFDDLLNEYKNINNDSLDDEKNQSRLLSELFDDAENNVKYELPDSDKGTNEGSDRFGSIINFQNFLLQVLKVMYHNDNDYQEEIDDEIKLDDKRLTDIFEKVLKASSDKKAFVKRYIMDLLFIRYIFDEYVIKRENYNGKESWSLKRLKKYTKNKVNNVYYVGTFSGDDNEDEISKDIRMLEAMFHVSAPTQIYKHWLNAILYYIYESEKWPSAEEMRDKLYTLACTYMLDRYLCDEKIDFEDIIYKNDFKASNNIISWNLLDNGCDVENFVFNFYDYITWKENPSKFSKFEFTYRTSVEHFYPQTPMPGYDNLKGKGLDDFGNLCLISRGMNSKFSNNMPKAKLENFGLVEEVKNGLSLKLLEMMDIVKEKGDWGKAQIEEFETDARNRILDALQKNNPKMAIKTIE